MLRIPPRCAAITVIPGVCVICIACVLSAPCLLAAPPDESISAPAASLKTPDVFTPPTPDERSAAAGSLKSVPSKSRSYFMPDERTRRLPPPQEGDWLAAHPEPQQSFDLFVKEQPNRPDRERTTIYLMPLEEFGNDAPPLDVLREFMQQYFAIPAKVLPKSEFPLSRITQRINPQTEQEQWLTTDVLRELQAIVPSDAYCLLGVTLTDLYPDPQWNYVFGQATLKRRVGVYSFARFDPSFFGQERPNDWQLTMRRRSFQLIAHETGHMFGIRHCVYYQCAMNGSNNQPESDSHPLRLCPVCLRKLHWAVKFDPAKREQSLAKFFETHQISDEPLTLRDSKGE